MDLIYTEGNDSGFRKFQAPTDSGIDVGDIVIVKTLYGDVEHLTKVEAVLHDLKLDTDVAEFLGEVFDIPLTQLPEVVAVYKHRVNMLYHDDLPFK